MLVGHYSLGLLPSLINYSFVLVVFILWVVDKADELYQYFNRPHSCLVWILKDKNLVLLCNWRKRYDGV
jgi:hypothetical protein